MAIHGLYTNAVEYRAPSTDGGRIAIAWDLERTGLKSQIFTLKWQESNGPAEIAPKHKGFGTVVLTSLLEAGTEGTVTFAFKPDGVSWTCRERWEDMRE
ncbi:hypothetical protein ACOI1H_25790 [Loktanella sp. DJP18]|uniref:hypothetical protein n=1 Tax=Loktanella sp. DJP18 TaxID=3409788 RepID=UPI003BB6B929